MKRTLLFFLLIAGIFNTQAQGQVRKSIAESESLINIPTGEVNKIFIKPVEKNDFLKSAQTDQIDFEVTYINFPEEAKAAFEYAVSIWENLLTSSVPVKIHATWEKFDNTALALGRPSTFHINFDEAQIPDTYYPVALAEKLAGKNINSGEADIFCRFNSNYPWYFGADGNTPSTKYDFVSSVLHEIVHGLGFSGFFDDSWKNAFESSWGNNTSSANGQETLFLKHSVNLTENTGLNAGDTLIFRFRLASDKSVSGWGWAIDNLEIQKGFTTGSESIENTAVSVYPNPFTNSFYVDCSEFRDSEELEIIVTDMFGKTVYHETGVDVFYATKKQVDLADKQTGVYLVNIRNRNKVISNHKIIKK